MNKESNEEVIGCVCVGFCIELGCVCYWGWVMVVCCYVICVKCCVSCCFCIGWACVSNWACDCFVLGGYIYWWDVLKVVCVLGLVSWLENVLGGWVRYFSCGFV